MYDIAVGFRQSIEQRSSVADFNEETQAGCALLGQLSTMSSLFSKAPPKAKEEKAAERAEADERKTQAYM